MDTSSIINCQGKSYFMQARTKEPVNSYILKLHTEDYGAFGFLRSFANINKGGAEAVSGQAPLFISVPIKREDVTHPMDRQNGILREKITE
jgi:hypothetical protein